MKAKVCVKLNSYITWYDINIKSKYALENAVTKISTMKEDAVAMIGEDLAIRAGDFIAAQIIEEEAKE